MKKDSEGGGYCALWALFVQELALLNQDMSVKEIVEEVLRKNRPRPAWQTFIAGRTRLQCICV